MTELKLMKLNAHEQKYVVRDDFNDFEINIVSYPEFRDDISLSIPLNNYFTVSCCWFLAFFC